MQSQSHDFKKKATRAAADEKLNQAMAKAQDGFVGKRARAIAQLPEFEALREQCKTIRDHVLANLDYYLERYEAAVKKQGGQVHWAETPEDAQAIVRDICKRTWASPAPTSLSPTKATATFRASCRGCISSLRVLKRWCRR